MHKKQQVTRKFVVTSFATFVTFCCLWQHNSGPEIAFQNQAGEPLPAPSGLIVTCAERQVRGRNRTPEWITQVFDV